MSGSDKDYLHHADDQSDTNFFGHFKSLKVPDNMLRAFNDMYGIEVEMSMSSGSQEMHQYDLPFNGSHYIVTSYYTTLRSRDQKQRCFNLQLRHNGFISMKQTPSTIETEADHWNQISMTPAIAEEMPFLLSLEEKLNATIAFRYSTKRKRLDVFLYARAERTDRDTTLPFLLITFDKSGPAPWGAFPRENNFF